MNKLTVLGLGTLNGSGRKEILARVGITKKKKKSRTI